MIALYKFMIDIDIDILATIIHDRPHYLYDCAQEHRFHHYRYH